MSFLDVTPFRTSFESAPMPFMVSRMRGASGSSPIACRKFLASPFERRMIWSGSVKMTPSLMLEVTVLMTLCLVLSSRSCSSIFLFWPEIFERSG